jgi:hypothetical protein
VLLWSLFCGHGDGALWTGGSGIRKLGGWPRDQAEDGRDEVGVSQASLQKMVEVGVWCVFGEGG